MADKPDSQQPQQIQINTADEISRGRYSNLMLVSHSAEEFMLDCLIFHGIDIKNTVRSRRDKG